MNTWEIKILNPRAVLPVHRTLGAAGFDLSCVETVTIEPHTRMLLPTGLAMKLPHGTYGRIASKSSYAKKRGLEVGAGVVDEDCTSEVFVLMHNHGDESVTLNAGERIAQMVITPYLIPEIRMVRVFTNEN